MNQPARCKRSRYRDHISNAESIKWAHNTVYLLWCPLDKCIKYVGYTRGYPWDRLAAHMAEIKNSPNHPKSLWLKRLKEAGLLPTMRLMKSFEDKQDAYKYEAHLIAHIGLRRPLTNKYVGHPNWRPAPGWHYGGGKPKVYWPGPNEILVGHPYAAWFPAGI